LLPRGLCSISWRNQAALVSHPDQDFWLRGCSYTVFNTLFVIYNAIYTFFANARPPVSLMGLFFVSRSCHSVVPPRISFRNSWVVRGEEKPLSLRETTPVPPNMLESMPQGISRSQGRRHIFSTIERMRRFSPYVPILVLLLVLLVACAPGTINTTSNQN